MDYDEYVFKGGGQGMCTVHMLLSDVVLLYRIAYCVMCNVILIYSYSFVVSNVKSTFIDR